MNIKVIRAFYTIQRKKAKKSNHLFFQLNSSTMLLCFTVKALFVSYLIFMLTYQGDCIWYSASDAMKFDSIRGTVVPKARNKVGLMNLSPYFVVRRDYIGKSKNKEDDSDIFLRLS